MLALMLLFLNLWGRVVPKDPVEEMPCSHAVNPSQSLSLSLFSLFSSVTPIYNVSSISVLLVLDPVM